MKTPTAAYLIERLALHPHPEGGWFRETHRDTLVVEGRSARVDGPRNASTAIYYLLERGDRSALHRIASDEVWHLYAGGGLAIHVLHPEGRHEILRLGLDLEAGERPQAVVPAGAWFGARIESDHDYVLVGCTVAPGFDFRDFEMASRETLLAAHPEHAAWIAPLT